MTYNIDPDQWYINELKVLQSEYKKGNLTRQQYDKLFDELDQKHTEMWQQLDGTYRML